MKADSDPSRLSTLQRLAVFIKAVWTFLGVPDILGLTRPNPRKKYLGPPLCITRMHGRPHTEVCAWRTSPFIDCFPS